MSNTAPSRADPVVVFPYGRWCPPQETSQLHPPQSLLEEPSLIEAPPSEYTLSRNSSAPTKQKRRVPLIRTLRNSYTHALKHGTCCSKSQWRPPKPASLLLTCLNRNMSKHTMSAPMMPEIAWNRSALHDVLAQGASNRDITVTTNVNELRWKLQMPKLETSCSDLTLTHWGWVTNIWISRLTIIGSDNGLMPGRHQAIIWTNAGMLWIQTLGTNSLSQIHKISFKKMHLKISSAKWRPFCRPQCVKRYRTP